MPQLGMLNIDDTLTISDGSTTTTITWSSGNQRWENSEYYLREMQFNNTINYRWRLYEKGTGSGDTEVSADGNTFDHANYRSPCDGTWSNNWTVTCGGAGAQGDPHVKPFFGKGYTI
jgi:hypothetical protein